MAVAIRFLADESCDFLVVRVLRSAGYDVRAIVEDFPGSADRVVLDAALFQQRVLITEDKDFGEWVFGRAQESSGVLLIRFPSFARKGLGEAVRSLVEERGEQLFGAFTVLEPGRARIRKS